MNYFECRQEKLYQYKIERQFKPFVDQNLQFQHPGWNLSNYNSQANDSHSPIYVHYVGSPSSYLPIEVNEAEIYQAIREAEGSYKAWKRLQQQLKEKSYQ